MKISWFSLRILSAACGYALLLSPPALLSAPAAQPMAGEVAASPGATLNPRHPDRYVVKRGDTLWEIAGMFLRDPWYWPEIWSVNPQIENPHLIYPGDVLTLVYDGAGRPRVELSRGETGAVAMGNATERLSPRVREEKLAAAIPTIPLHLVRAFLDRGGLLTQQELDALPYVLEVHEQGIGGGAPVDLYVRGPLQPANTMYTALHIQGPLKDPDSGRFLGYQAIFVGEGTLRREGDPATIRLTMTQREVKAGDRLMPGQPIFPLNFLPHAPTQSVQGRIINVPYGDRRLGPNQVVVLNRGKADGLEVGSVLQIVQAGATIRDPHVGWFGERVKTPDEPAGIAMVFRTYERASYALIMRAYGEIHVNDLVRNPG